MGLFSKIRTKLDSKRGITENVRHVYSLTHKFLPTNPIILEAGAHMGYDTVGLSKIWSQGTVYAVEPIPNLYKELTQRTKGKKNVKTFQIGFGPENTFSKIFVSGGDSTGSSSLLKPTAHKEFFPSVTFTEEIQIEVRTIDQWIKSERIPVLDFLWLDMQGYEVPALRGATTALQNVSVIYTELCSKEVYEGMITQDRYIEFLKSYGFELVHLINGPDIFSDGVFVNVNKVKL